MITNINTKLTKINRIYQISDVHIRNLTRHKEYLDVFKTTFDYINSTKTENDIIVVSGDVVHLKTEMVPELIDVVTQFFTMCANTLPTIIITGNHDANLNNTSRLDALSPIIDVIGNKNLIYLKDSGVYQIADKTFTVMSVFDKPDAYIRANEFDSNYKIALYHGTVNGAKTDLNHVLLNDKMPITMFDGYDLALLGDIHKPNQILQTYYESDDTIHPLIAYPGSLIQQNYGECEEHGILIWDTDAHSAQFHKIENNTVFTTIQLSSIDCNINNIISKNNALKSIYLRVIVDTDKYDVNAYTPIINKIKNKYNIIECRVETTNDALTTSSNKCITDEYNVFDIDNQNKLIVDFLKQYNLSSDVINQIKELNQEINSELNITDNRYRVTWNPIKFEFSNMFSYGEHNVIEFGNLHGTYGVFAPNASGKSSIFDAILYCIFDKCSRTSIASEVMNNTKNSFKCKLTFELNNEIYVIERSAQRKSHDSKKAPVSVNFYKYDSDNNIVNLNGEKRSDTNNKIRSLLGEYEDFILTAFATQNNNSGFVYMTQKQRKELLSYLLNIDIFDSLSKIASTKSNGLKSIIKELSNTDYQQQLDEQNNKINELNIELSSLTEDKNSVQNKIKNVNDDIIDITKKIIQTNITTDINVLQQNKLDCENQIESYTKQISQFSLNIDGYNNTSASLAKQIELYDINKLNDNLNEYKKWNDIEKNKYSEASKLKVEIQNKKDKLAKLGQLEYDPNCKYCMNNIFVKDAIQTKETIDEDIKHAKIIVSEYNTAKEKVNNLNDSINSYNTYNELNKQITTAITSRETVQNKIHTIENTIAHLRLQLNSINNQIDEYNKNKEIIDANHQYELQINELKNDLQQLNAKLQSIDGIILNVNSQITTCNVHIETIRKNIQKLKQYNSQYQCYEYYIKATNRDGIPFNLISNVIPVIEQSINNILSQIIDFKIELKMEDADINCYIKYDDDSIWAVELGSGMERFVSNIAIRVILTKFAKICPNMLMIDEGFGVLDSTNLNEISNLFAYLKSQFKFIFIVSHIDVMKDMVERIINITKDDDLSHICIK